MSTSGFPLIVGTRRNGRQRYAATTDVRMRYVKSRAAAILATAGVLGALMLAAPSLSDRCEAVTAGTDNVPADILAICD